MARSAGDPKVRYIGFRLDSAGPVPRKGLIEAIRRAGQAMPGADIEAAAPWLTRYDGQRGIVRCHHRHAAMVRDLLAAIQSAPGDDGPVDVTVTTVGTSGTIRGLVERHLPDLQDQGRKR